MSALIDYSRTEPARTILFVVSGLTAIMQVAALFVTGAFRWVAVPNTAVVVVVAGWACHSAYKKHIKHMSTASFWVCMMWLWSGLSRMLFSHDAGHLLWVPFLVVAAALSVVYIYLSHQMKVGRNE